MIPKKANKLYKEVAEQLNIDEALVETFIEFYYKEVKNTLSNLQYPRVNVEGLGHFVAKPGLVRKHIPRITKVLEEHDTSTFGAFHNKKMLMNKLELLIKLEKQIAKEENRKVEFKQKKNEITKDNLGE